MQFKYFACGMKEPLDILKSMSFTAISMVLCSSFSIRRSSAFIFSRNQSIFLQKKLLSNNNFDITSKPIRALGVRRESIVSKNAKDDDLDQQSNSDFEPTWTYVPYKPPPPPSKRKSNRINGRNFSTSRDNWVVPKTVSIPMDQLNLTFTKSSGAGGQNVNKVNTRVEIRFHVMTASWIPKEVRERLAEQQSSRINKDGMMVVDSQEHRTQGRNREECMKKLKGARIIIH